VSERRACKAIVQPRSKQRYREWWRGKKAAVVPVKIQQKEWVNEERRGCWWLWVMGELGG